MIPDLLVIFGDDITYGYNVQGEGLQDKVMDNKFTNKGFKEDYVIYSGKKLSIPKGIINGWANYLCDNIRNMSSITSFKPKHTYLTYNLSVFEATTATTMSRLEEELNKRVLQTNEKIILIALGINDSRYYYNNEEHNERRYQTPKKEFKVNMEYIIRSLFLTLPEEKTKVVVLGLTRVDEERTTPFVINEVTPFENKYENKQVFYDNKTIGEYDSLIKEVVHNLQREYSRERLFFIEIFNKFPSSKYFFSDGLHPNRLGHTILYYLVTEELFAKSIINNKNPLDNKRLMLNEVDFDYNPRQKLEHLPPYIREKFVIIAELLLQELENNRLRVSLIPNKEYEGFKRIRIVESHNPSWYKTLFHQNKYWKRDGTKNALLRIINNRDGNYGIRRFKYDFIIRNLIYEILSSGHITPDGIYIPRNRDFILFMENIEEDVVDSKHDKLNKLSDLLL